MKALISIIIPIYNGQKYLSRCLLSVIKQSYQNIEIILIDDGSSDNSYDIALKYAKEDKRIKLFKQANQGSSKARNLGLDVSSGEYIMFLDVDDYYLEDCILKAYKRIKQDDSDIAIFEAKFIDEDNNYIKSTKVKYKDTISLKKHKEAYLKIESCVWDKIYKKELFKKYNLYFEDGLLYQDYGIMPKILLNVEKISFIDEELIIYTANNPNSITQEISKRLYHIFINTDSIINYYKKHKQYNTYKEELKALAIINIIDKLKIVLKSNDKKFIKEYIRYTYKYLKDNFNDFKSIYNLKSNNKDFIYFNPILIRLYLLIKKGILF